MTPPNSLAPRLIGLDDGLAAPDAGQVGAKAAQLWRMHSLGLTVPPGFVLPTALCAAVNAGEPAALAALEDGLRQGIARLEVATGRRFGDRRAPLLVSVRSGAARSMPGMLETLLNVGLAEPAVHGLIAATGNPRLAWDSYRRFLQAWAEVVDGAPAAAFAARSAELLHEDGLSDERDLDPETLERLARGFEELARRAAGHPVPDDPMAQLIAAARAVYASWDGARAREYRRLNGLDGLAGTAVTVQAMVFGNAGGRSGAGVAFSRDPATGADTLYVDFLFDVQGEDVVSGRRSATAADATQLAARLPEVAAELAAGAATLERAFADAQDIEFTVEEGRLWFLQTRAAKRTPRAALRIAVDLVHAGVLDRAEALARLARIDLDAARITRFGEPATPLATAVPASPGVACGRAVFDSARAQALAAAGEQVILVRPDTTTEDVAGFAVASGILTAAGSRTAHAAVVARQLGKPCLVGCGALQVDPAGRSAMLAGTRIAEGDWLAIDGEAGTISLGRRAIISEAPAEELAELTAWRAATRVSSE